MSIARRLLCALALAAAAAAPFAVVAVATPAAASPSDPEPDESSAVITMYGATWCSACKSLEQSLKDRKIPFEKIDIEQEQARWAWAKKESGQGGAIPLTSVYRKTNGMKWIVGADPDAIVKAAKE
jgi:glutaredoxin